MRRRRTREEGGDVAPTSCMCVCVCHLPPRNSTYTRPEREYHCRYHKTEAEGGGVTTEWRGCAHAGPEVRTRSTFTASDLPCSPR